MALTLGPTTLRLLLVGAVAPGSRLRKFWPARPGGGDWAPHWMYMYTVHDDGGEHGWATPIQRSGTHVPLTRVQMQMRLCGRPGQ